MVWNAGIQLLHGECHDLLINDAGVYTVTPDRCAVLCCRVHKAVVRRTTILAPHPDPANHLTRATSEVIFLHSDSWCQQYVSDLSSFTPRYVDIRRGISVKYDIELTTCLPVVQMEGSRHHF